MRVADFPWRVFPLFFDHRQARVWCLSRSSCSGPLVFVHVADVNHEHAGPSDNLACRHEVSCSGRFGFLYVSLCLKFFSLPKDEDMVAFKNCEDIVLVVVLGTTTTKATARKKPSLPISTRDGQVGRLCQNLTLYEESG